MKGYLKMNDVKIKMHIDMLKDEISAENIDLFEDILELISGDTNILDELISMLDFYDYYSLYHLIFELYGHEMNKNEYIALRNRYIKLFDIEFIPLPGCCEELDEGWGLKDGVCNL